MNQLLADSGSTKTHWVLLTDNGDVSEFMGPGINPTVQREEEVGEIIRKSLEGIEDQLLPQYIYFYGAGCSNRGDKAVVKKAIRTGRFEKSEVEVEHDLFAAARSLFGTGDGLACILGTGSSSCVFENGSIKNKLTSLGYVLGDDGGGVDLGKRLIRSVVSRSLDADLREQFFDQFKITEEGIVATLYKKAGPNRFLASFAPFLKEHLKNEACSGIVRDSFQSFLKYSVEPYHRNDLKLGFVGSVAYFFRPLLEEVCNENGYEIHKVLQNPMEGLIDFHRSQR